MHAARSSRVASRICSTRVPFSMASRTSATRLGAEPHRSAARPAERIDVAVAQEQVGPAQALEGGAGVALLDQLREAQPARLQPQDVIGEPDVGAVGRLKGVQLGDDVVGAPDVVALAPDRLGTPVAVVRAAAAGCHVQREVAVVPLPDLAVASDVREVPRGNRSESRSRRSAAAASARGRYRRSAGTRGPRSSPGRRSSSPGAGRRARQASPRLRHGARSRPRGRRTPRRGRSRPSHRRSPRTRVPGLRRAW